MKLPYFFTSILKGEHLRLFLTKDKLPYILGGIVAGVLGLWLTGKILAPWVKPVVKSACMNFLDLNTGRGGGGEERTANVEAVRVELGVISRRLVTVGQLRANESVTLRSEIPGKIKKNSL